MRSTGPTATTPGGRPVAGSPGPIEIVTVLASASAGTLRAAPRRAPSVTVNAPPAAPIGADVALSVRDPHATSALARTTTGIRVGCMVLILLRIVLGRPVRRGSSEGSVA